MCDNIPCFHLLYTTFIATDMNFPSLVTQVTSKYQINISAVNFSKLDILYPFMK